MMERPQDGWTQPDFNAEVRRYSSGRMKQAWRGLTLSTVLLAIAAMTFNGLRAGHADPTQHAAYIGILCLFFARFTWSAWRFLSARRDVTRFRTGIERQLKRSDVPRSQTDPTP
jgi:hypothetical protein